MVVEGQGVVGHMTLLHYVVIWIAVAIALTLYTLLEDPEDP